MCLKNKKPMFIPTHQGQKLLIQEINAFSTCSSITKNFNYFTLTPKSFIDFDWLVLLDSTKYSYSRPPLQQ